VSSRRTPRPDRHSPAAHRARLTGPAVLFGAIYLLAHGLVKVVLVVALLLNKLWACPWMIAILTLFIGYQLYRIALHPTIGLVALTLFDATILILTWREYRVQRSRRVEAPSPAGHHRVTTGGRKAGMIAAHPEPLDRSPSSTP